MNAVPDQFHNIYLRPGDLYISQEPSLVTTVLGSCVSVTLFHPESQLAAICHALLAVPGRSSASQSRENLEPYNYVSHAVPAMIEAFRTRGIHLIEVQAKLFGGANVFGTHNGDQNHRGVGSANIHLAQQLLEECRLSIASRHVGGAVGRKIIFNTTTGVVLLKQLSPSTPSHHSRSHHKHAPE